MIHGQDPSDRVEDCYQGKLMDILRCIQIEVPRSIARIIEDYSKP